MADFICSGVQFYAIGTPFKCHRNVIHQIESMRCTNTGKQSPAAHLRKSNVDEVFLPLRAENVVLTFSSLRLPEVFKNGSDGNSSIDEFGEAVSCRGRGRQL